jgi:hypothetical protein
MKTTLRALLYVACMLYGVSVSGQIQIDERTPNTIKDRGYLGLGIGGLGLGTSSVGTYYSIGVTPQVGYMINPYLSPGLAFEYQYVGYTGGVNQHYSQYGWYPYLRFNIKKFFIQTDYDTYYVPVNFGSDRKVFNRFLLGLGFFTPGRKRGGFNMLISYDVLYTANSPFNSPLSFRAFFTF